MEDVRKAAPNFDREGNRVVLVTRRQQPMPSATCPFTLSTSVSVDRRLSLSESRHGLLAPSATLRLSRLAEPLPFVCA